MLVKPLLAACSMLASSAAAVSPDDCPDYECGCGKAHALRLRHAAGLPISEEGRPGYGVREAMTDTDLLRCDLEIEIDPVNETITGVNVMRVRSLVNGLTDFTIMLRTNYTVTGATINGVTPVAVPSPASGSYGRRITLDRAYAAGEEFTLRIPYSGVAVSRGFGSIEFQTQPSSTNPIVASLSEAYFAATWWPCKDGDVFVAGDNSDKFIMNMGITAPASLTSVSNGVLTATQDLPGGKRRYYWEGSSQIATYLVAFASSVYNTWSRTYTYTPDEGGPDRTMPVVFYIYPGSDTANNRAAWERTLPMLDTFRTVYGLYPFVAEKYGIYQFPFGGGMEHQTMTGQGTFSESVTAHELAHQWWGDNVTCKTWNHIWLNEGFATYGEALWEQYKAGSSGEPALHAAMNARRPSNVGDTVYVSNVADMNRIFSSTYTYRKGGWVLHTLRHIIGDESFFDGLREYRSRFGGSGATTEDFAATMAFVSDRNLDNYFQQAVYGVGAPAYAYGWQSAPIGGQHYARVSLRQTQNAAWPGVGSPANAFATPIDVRIDLAGGGSRTFSITPAARTSHFVLPIPEAATGVALDEFNWVLATDKVAEGYTNGPAKIVQASPSPGQTLGLASSPASVSIAFSEGVNSTSAAFSVAGPGGTVPVTVTGANGTTGRTLTFTSALPAGNYTVTVQPTVTSTNGGAQLDGEITANLLPSGDSVAGGTAQWSFTVEGESCAADYNADGGVDGGDVEAFFVDWEQGAAGADVNQDGGVDGGDVEFFFVRWEAGGC
jgi:methionine-rich copper-binding protein CopC